jgi:predicted amidohydrolase
MEVIACQLDIAWEDKPANFRSARSMVESARPTPGALVVLPEMFATGFSMETTRTGEARGGETEQFLGALAKEFGVCVVGGAAIHDGHRLHNEAVAFGPDARRIAAYAKMQPFRLAEEDQSHAPGERPLVFSWADWSIAPFVCYDLRFPEIFRAAAFRHRPQLIVVIANWAPKRILHWVRLLQARAIENQAYVVGVNRVGRDPTYEYNGRSVIVDPHGELIAEAGASQSFIRAMLDREGLESYRRELPFLEDVRSDWVRGWE